MMVEERSHFFYYSIKKTQSFQYFFDNHDPVASPFLGIEIYGTNQSFSHGIKRFRAFGRYFNFILAFAPVNIFLKIMLFCKSLGFLPSGLFYFFLGNFSFFILSLLIDPLNDNDIQNCITKGCKKFDRMLFLEENRRDILYGVGLLESPADRIQAVTADSIRGLVSALEKGIEREQKHGTFSSLANPKTLALTLAVLCSGIQKGEIYAILFLSQSNLRRIWFHSIKLFLNPAISP